MPKKQINFAKMARSFAATGKIGEAMVAAGYSRRSSQRGMASMSHTNREKFSEALNAHESKMLSKFAEIGKSVSAEAQQDLVRGALLSNVAQGKDKATNSLKLLGSDKRVNMFEPDSKTGVIIIQAVPIPSFDLKDDVPSRKLDCGCYVSCQCARSRKALP